MRDYMHVDFLFKKKKIKIRTNIVRDEKTSAHVNDNIFI